jgi:LPS-assembly protein
MKKFFLVSSLWFLVPFAGYAAKPNVAEEPKTIIADKIEYNAKTKGVKTTGATEITTRSGSKMTLNDAYIDNGGMTLSGGKIGADYLTRTRFEAESVKREGPQSRANHVFYTACRDCDEDFNAWHVTARGISHNTDDKMILFESPTFYFYEVPVLWLPAFSMPDPTVKHKSGLLFPNMNSTNNMGTQFNLPLYLYLSEYQDMTITGSYLTQENPLVQIEHRLNAHRSSFKTTGSYTHNKERMNRWHLFSDGNVELGEDARARLFLQRTSDPIYLLKYGLYNSQPYLDSGGKLELFDQTGYVTGEVHTFQELRSYDRNKSRPSGDILPNIHGVWQSDPVYGDSYFTLMGDMLGISGQSGGGATQRMLGSASFIAPVSAAYGQRLTFSASARYDVYNFMDSPDIDGNDINGIRARFLPMGYAQWELPLIRQGEDWDWVIEPIARLSVLRRLSTPAFANNDSSGSLLTDAVLFSDNRFSGYDLWENGNYLDYGAKFTVLSGEKSIEAFAGQSYDFYKQAELDPNSGFHNGASDYVGRVNLFLIDNVGFYNRFRVSNADLSMRHWESNVVIGDKKNYLNFGYIYATQFLDIVTLDKSIEEAVVGFGIGLTERWIIRADTIYNITDTRIQNQRLGIMYDHPCYDVSFEVIRDGTVRPGYRGNTIFRFGFNVKFTE